MILWSFCRLSDYIFDDCCLKPQVPPNPPWTVLAQKSGPAAIMEVPRHHEAKCCPNEACIRLTSCKVRACVSGMAISCHANQANIRTRDC